VRPTGTRVQYWNNWTSRVKKLWGGKRKKKKRPSLPHESVLTRLKANKKLWKVAKWPGRYTEKGFRELISSQFRTGVLIEGSTHEDTSKPHSKTERKGGRDPGMPLSVRKREKGSFFSTTERPEKKVSSFLVIQNTFLVVARAAKEVLWVSLVAGLRGTCSAGRETSVCFKACAHR